MKYRKKPIEIEAWQWDGTVKSVTSGDAPEWLDEAMKDHKVYFRVSQYDPKHPHMSINTLEGQMRVDKDDYIIRGVEGELYPCKPGIFERTYEEVPGGEEV